MQINLQLLRKIHQKLYIYEKNLLKLLTSDLNDDNILLKREK